MNEPTIRPRLVLDVPPDAVERLKRSALLHGGRRTASSRTVYYDTPDLSLRERAVAVTRRDGTPAGGREVVPVDLEATPHAPDTPLRPIFEATLARTVRRLAVGGATLRVELSAGQLVSAKAVAPFARVVLDLEAGGPEALATAALDLHRAVPARLSVETEIDRGYALAAGLDAEAVRIVRAQPVPLGANLTVEQGMARLLRGCLDHWIGNEAAVRDHGAAEGVHQMRVALRRLRAVVGQFRPMLPADAVAAFAVELRWLAGRLGEAREWDVMLAETLPPVEAAFPGEPALAALRQTAEMARDASYQRLRRDLDGDRYARLLYGIAAWTVGFGWRQQPLTPPAAALFQPLAPYASAAVARRCRKLLRDEARPSGLPAETRHALRKRLKRTRYLIELFQPLWSGKTLRRLSKRLAAVQDALGRANDLATAHRLLDPIGSDGDRLAARGAGLVLGWHAGAGTDAGREIDRCWKMARAAALAA